MIEGGEKTHFQAPSELYCRRLLSRFTTSFIDLSDVNALLIVRGT